MRVGGRISYLAVKRALDVAGSAIGLLALAPVLGSAAASVYLSLGRPILFRQQRPGKGGKPFRLLKFRTMRTLRPGEDMLSTDADRITAIGRFLRSTSIDELPTLLNVLRGEMSLVGPRPLLTQYLDRYSAEQARRHDVKPGITGWAQIHGRNALSWQEKFALDVWYVDHASIGLDLEILVKTVLKVVTREGINEPGAVTMSEFMGDEGKPDRGGSE